MAGSPALSRRSSTTSTTSSSAALPRFEDLAPPRPPTTVEAEETVVTVPGIPKGVRLHVDAGPGCGGIAWPAGEVLSRYLAYRTEIDPSCLRNRTILELGSGTGLVGIAAGLLQPESEIWVTDQAPLLDLMRRNISLNFPDPPCPVHLAELNWGDPMSQEIPIDEVDLVLAADCVYFEPAFPLLVQTLCDLAPIGKKVDILFCWKKRRKADKRFFSMLKKHFDSTPIEDDRPGEKERYTREGVSLLRLTRKR